MVPPAVRREAVDHLEQAFEVSQRRTCDELGVDDGAISPQRGDDTALQERIRDLAAGLAGSPIAAFTGYRGTKARGSITKNSSGCIVSPALVTRLCARCPRLWLLTWIFAALAAKGETPDQLMIDATHLKAHRTAASPPKVGLKQCLRSQTQKTV